MWPGGWLRGKRMCFSFRLLWTQELADGGYCERDDFGVYDLNKTASAFYEDI
jgi:hypothetical protein